MVAVLDGRQQASKRSSISSRLSATQAVSRARLPHQMTGIASSTPMGSSQRWPLQAAKTMTDGRSGSRAMSGMGTEPGTVLEPVLLVSSANQSAQSPGVTSAVTAMTASVAAMARLKLSHSRRTRTRGCRGPVSPW